MGKKYDEQSNYSGEYDNLMIIKAKANRLRVITPKENSIPFLRRGMRRYKQLSKDNQQHIVIAYFINRIAFHAKSFVIAKLTRWLPFVRRSRIPFIEADPDKLTYSIRITGGLGDALIVARLVRDLQVELGEQARFDVYFHSPKLIEHFFHSINGVREICHDSIFPAVAHYYHFSLFANQYVVFYTEHIRWAVIVDRFPKVLKLVGRIESFRKPIEKYISVHPALDGAFADLAVKQGHRRMTFLHEMMGISYGGDQLDITLDPDLTSRLGLEIGSYITVHDGWDNNFKLVANRPTKSVPLQSWAEIVSEIKTLRPDIQIVQIGAKTGADIPGVDVNLKNKLLFHESVAILAGSLLHLDTESGLVHVAASLGVRCVVMFGPTNVDWFGYPQNINIVPKRCGNCWWSTDSWMDSCPIGHEVPVCTGPDSITPSVVAARAVSVIDELKSNLFKSLVINVRK